MIVDTTLLVDLLRGDEMAVRRTRELEASGAVLWIPASAAFELMEGVERADRPEAERRRVDEILDAYTVLPFSLRHADRAGIVSGRLIRRGDMIDPIDAQIAGTALAEQMPVLTRNIRHFERVPDIEVETY